MYFSKMFYVFNWALIDNSTFVAEKATQYCTIIIIYENEAIRDSFYLFADSLE